MPMNVPQCLITTSTNGLAVSMCSLLSIYHRKSWAVIADTSHFKMLNRSSSHICKPNDGVITYTMFIYINNNYNNNSSSSSNNNNNNNQFNQTFDDYKLQRIKAIGFPSSSSVIVITAAATGGCPPTASVVCRKTFIIIYKFVWLQHTPSGAHINHIPFNNIFFFFYEPNY